MLDFDACYRAVTARDVRFDGRFFTGVTSTGVYCRPICPARTPARRNVRFFTDAAAAESEGFRPCKRCRPEASPGSPDWDVRGNLVGRALRLIDEGIVDEAGVRGLAARLHVTERHLHRLFLAEVGAAPLSVARTRRLQLARRLLTETGLPVTDVAFASGFGSVRQFNASIRTAYGQPPTEIRTVRTSRTVARAASGNTSANTNGNTTTLTLRLAYRPPYDAAALLGFLRPRAIRGVEEITDGTYARTIRTASGPGVLELTPADGHVLLRVDAGGVHGVARIVARCRRLFDLDADPTAVAAVLATDPALRPLVDRRPGLRVPGTYDPFELAVRAVLGQQVSVAAASALAGRLVERHGEPLTSPNGGLTHMFPSPAALTEADLGAVGMPQSRRRTLRTLAAAVAAGELDLEIGADPAETAARLREVPGIGPWTVAYIAMRALRDPDAYPETDLGVRRAAGQLDAAPNPERWRPWRAYGAMHLWTSLAEDS